MCGDGHLSHYDFYVGGESCPVCHHPISSGINDPLLSCCWDHRYGFTGPHCTVGCYHMLDLCHHGYNRKCGAYILDTGSTQSALHVGKRTVDWASGKDRYLG